VAFFDFLNKVPSYQDKPSRVERLNKRYAFLISDFADDIKDARALDLGAHDGRWAYAIAAAGAHSVTGIEAREALSKELDHVLDAEIKLRINMRVDDVFAGLEAAVAADETYDFIAIYGLFYHIMDHFRMLDLVRQLKPKLVVIDSDFTKQNGAVIRLVREDTENPLNASAVFEGQKKAIKGVPSRAALEVMADVLGFDTAWTDWGRLPQDQRRSVKDYFPSPDRALRRGTCVLRPKPSE